MKKTVPLIHIGYPKTATTWLQEYLFPNRALGFDSPFSSKDIRLRLVETDALDFDSRATVEWFQPRLEAAQAEGYVPVISRERLSGHHLGGPNDSAEIANRLHSLFPHAKVLMVIRKQQEMLYSAHGQVVKGLSTTWPLQEHLAAHDTRWHRANVMFPVEHFQYDRLIRRYHLLFGHDNVLVLPYEQFRDKPQTFVQAILAFCNQTVDAEIIAQLPFNRPSNPSLSAISIAIKRRLNWLFGNRSRYNPFVVFSKSGNSDHKRNLRFINLLIQMDRLLPSTWKKTVEQRRRQEIAQLTAHLFGPSNRRTVELTGLDLAAYHYDMED